MAGNCGLYAAPRLEVGVRASRVSRFCPLIAYYKYGQIRLENTQIFGR